MAILSMGECKWRMLRRVLHRKRFTYDDCRNQGRHDKEHFDWLLDHGFIVEIAPDRFELAGKAREAADLGFYEI